MSETLDLVAATGSAIDADLFEDAVQVLIKSAWRNCTEDTVFKTLSAREQYFGNGPDDKTFVVVGSFDGENVSAAMGNIETWNYPGDKGEYLGYLGKKTLSLTLFGVRTPYRSLGFGMQTLGAVAEVGCINDCVAMSMTWADFQWDWFQARGGFEGRFGLIAESVRSLPVHYPGFDTSQLQIRD